MSLCKPLIIRYCSHYLKYFFKPRMISKYCKCANLKHWALVKVVSTGSSFESRKGYVSSCQGRDVTKLICTKCRSFFFSRPNEALGIPPISLTTRCTIVLVWLPRCCLICTLVNGKALWAAGVELQPDVCDLIGFTCKEQTVYSEDSRRI